MQNGASAVSARSNLNASGSAIRRKTPINFTEARKECIVLATGLSPWPNDPASLKGTESTSSTAQSSPEDSGPGVDPATNQTATVVDWLSEQLRRYGPVNYVKLPRYVGSLWQVPFWYMLAFLLLNINKGL
ncbi:unnamed protein product [Dibothriocephalus latus]|uniref:Uncharacterized protein n=1 Tax=Dibothriocephalus latus TaxID=60516 RepID=A0A3P7Q269_DIBLA|nr:unnamed protein product [Dibothriocephalus latus]